MDTNFITENTIYDDRFYNKYVNFNFDDIAKERKKFIENTSTKDLHICVPISYSKKLNILQIIVLKKAKALSKHLKITILVKSFRNDESKEFLRKINSKFHFPEESFVMLDEIEKFNKKSLSIVKKFDEEELNIETQNYLIYITKLLLFLHEKEIKLFMVGQNEAFLFEVIIGALNPKLKEFKFYPLYIPELQLFNKDIIFEGDSIESIQSFFYNVLYQYRSKESGIYDLLVIASFFNLKLDNGLDAFLKELSNEIHTLLNN